MSAQSSTTPVVSVPSRFAKLAAYYKSEADNGFFMFEKYDNNFRLPIKKICGITVHSYLRVFLSHDKTQRLQFRIDTDRNMWEASENTWERLELFILHEPTMATKKTRELTLANYENMLELIYENLSKITLDPLHASFETYQSPLPTEELSLLVNHSLTECPTCCVCKELNFGIYTQCGHTVCLPCFDQIKPSTEDDGIDINCPLCRDQIGMV